MDNDEIRISDLLYTVFKHRKTILVLGLLGFLCGFVFSGISFLRNSRTNYAVNCSVAITSQPSANGVIYNSDYLSSNTFYQTLDMMDAATFVMKSERTLQAAIDRAGLVSVTTQAVSQNLQISRYNETQVLLRTLTWNNAEAGVHAAQCGGSGRSGCGRRRCGLAAGIPVAHPCPPPQGTESCCGSGRDPRPERK